MTQPGPGHQHLGARAWGAAPAGRQLVAPRTLSLLPRQPQGPPGARPHLLTRPGGRRPRDPEGRCPPGPVGWGNGGSKWHPKGPEDPVHEHGVGRTQPVAGRRPGRRDRPGCGVAGRQRAAGGRPAQAGGGGSPQPHGPVGPAPGPPPQCPCRLLCGVVAQTPSLSWLLPAHLVPAGQGTGDPLPGGHARGLPASPGGAWPSSLPRGPEEAKPIAQVPDFPAQPHPAEQHLSEPSRDPTPVPLSHAHRAPAALAPPPHSCSGQAAPPGGSCPRGCGHHSRLLSAWPPPATGRSPPLHPARRSRGSGLVIVLVELKSAARGASLPAPPVMGPAPRRLRLPFIWATP